VCCFVTSPSHESSKTRWLLHLLLLLLLPLNLQNVDVIRKPQPPTSPVGIQKCSRQLMPWSVFPCYPIPAPDGYPNPNQRSK
jgi:hypothetical protein